MVRRPRGGVGEPLAPVSPAELTHIQGEAVPAWAFPGPPLCPSLFLQGGLTFLCPTEAGSL